MVGIEADLFQCAQRRFLSLFFVDTGDLQAEGGVLQDGQVRHQGKGLEYHAHVPAPQGDQLFVVHLRDVLAIDVNMPGGRLDQPVEKPHHGRFAGAREAHDDEYLAGENFEAGIVDADGHAGLFM